MRIYSGFNVIEAGIFFTETSDYLKKLYGRYIDLVHKLDTSGPHLLTGLFNNCVVYLFQVFCVNRDGCHKWARKCSLFPENQISLPLMGSRVHTFIIYTLQSSDYVYD